MIQELLAGGLLKNSKGILMCGKAVVERKYYDYTCAMLMDLILTGDPLKGNSLELDEPIRSILLSGRHPAGFAMLQTIAGCYHNAGKGLEFLIRATKRFQATDSRDKVYALLGLTLYPYNKFPVVYSPSKPLKDVLMHLVQFLINADENLNILLGNRSLEDRVGASWLPELTSPQIFDMWLPNWLKLKAAWETTPEVGFDSTSAILRARGKIVGRLQAVIQAPCSPTEKLSNTTTTLEVLTSCGGESFTNQLTAFSRSLISDSEMEDLWRTLVLNHDFRDLDPEYPAPKEFGSMFEAAYCQGSGPESHSTESQEGIERYKFAFPFLKSMEKCVTGRCFFTTNDGRMGLGPMCAKPGDLVVMLYGGDFLFVLRETGERYELIGDAYVHGLMHGELVNDGDVTNSRCFELE